MQMMDYREAKACLDEFSSGLSAMCNMLRPNVAQGDLGAAIEDLNETMIVQLNALVREALILSVMVWKGISARPERMWEFPEECTEVFVALKQLDQAIANAIKVGEEKANREKAYADVLASREIGFKYGYKEKLLIEIEFEKKYGHLYPYREGLAR
jgi:hypothetical protein